MIHLSSWLFFLIVAAYAATIISCVVVVLSENRNPIRSLSWVLALIFLPVVGLVFYLFFGRSLRNIHMISRSSKRRLMERSGTTGADLSKADLAPSRKPIVKLAHSLTKAPLTANNEIEVFTIGTEKFESLRRDILAAKEYIYLQYYIFRDDALGREIADMLVRKAREGVEVKVIYDHVGSFSWRDSFFDRMREAGVDTHPFFRVSVPQMASRINWRNHRKIVVIDGRVGYIGGMNIAERYAPADPAAWRDTHFRVRGDIVSQLFFSFALDWGFMGQPLDRPAPGAARDVAPNSVGMQLVTSGPTSAWDNQALCFLRAIGAARKCIYIQTPYFLPTDALLHGLEAASLAKVDVRVMIPRRSDSRLLQLASFSYVTQCLRAGIKVYLYDPGMLHAKTMIIDEDFVTTGSTNFDFRSFENNFECNLMVYDPAFNARMREIFFADMARCTKLTYGVWRRRPRGQRLLESIVRLMAPVL